ncbi:TatD family nuclease-associated radical SAM protein [Shewanella sp. CG12_big_fil_rev_8_21_14_0_65_47_15]|uniref:TatD family nuclease-associated radical SAM protein n=1 Tax=Shewanella sp. CG12_big_fil_rev_8_21_14_0_65_47_15 TaxID=1975537 RepID=UPI000CB0A6C1|nr:TatD family nuclease-associated radical SAM protein [Shewanella sp. CG12_big_fil_rev_8_21_14_0_65_47_15]PIW61773.1 MAG: radical SAM protein [Shewanella sp. CG12_big_fil_rev_8_21_14_0_65_47_15]
MPNSHYAMTKQEPQLKATETLPNGHITQEVCTNETCATETLVYDIRRSRYLNITGRCTLRCTFCPKHNGSKQLHEYQLALTHQPKPEEIIPLLGSADDFEEYVFCGYGEPTLNLPTLIAVAKEIKHRGGRVRVNTDGLANLVHRRNILPELAQWVDSLSISLNADNETAYNQHCRPKLADSYAAVNAFISLAPHYIERVQVSAIEGLAGVDIDLCREQVLAYGCEFKHRVLGTLG